MRSTLSQARPGAPPHAPLGAVSFLHRFGSSLNAHFHFHLVVLDGLFSQADDGALRFHEATGIGSEDAERLARTVQRRVLRHFVRRGLLDDSVAHDMLTWQAAGGFSLDASVRVEGLDRAGRERLLRYCAVRRSRSNASTPNSPPHPRPPARTLRSAASATGSPDPHPTAAPCWFSHPSYSSMPSPASSRHRACTASATTASSPPTLACGAP